MTTAPITIPFETEIAAQALALRPRDARKQNDRSTWCSSPIYTSIRLKDGTLCELAYENGRYGAGYVRVSSRRQQQDGWSAEDQIKRIVAHYVGQGLAFRIFSDVGLPGSLAYLDGANGDTLLQRLLEKKARRYEDAYTRIFLTEPKYARHMADMQSYLKKRLEDIRAGRDGVGELLGAEEFPLPPIGRPNSAPTYRPGLTTLVECLPEIHTLAVTDLSRISRSQILFADFVERLIHYRVQVVGLMEDLSWVSGGDVSADIVKYVLSRLAEHRLGELAINVLRGQVTALEAGQPVGRIPSYFSRTEGGKAYLNERAQDIRRIVDMVLSGTPLIRICITFQQEGIPVLGHDGNQKGRGWSNETIKRMLLNPALTGKQVLFGIEWPVLPALVTDEEWECVKARLEAGKGHPRRANRYLASQLFRCSCGSKMIHRPVTANICQYICAIPIATRKTDKSVAHVALNVPNTDAFLNELMRYDPEVVIAPWRDTLERSQIKEEVERWEARRQELKAHLPEEEARAREKALVMARKIGAEGDEGVVAALTRKELASSGVPGELEETEREIRKLRRRLESILPTDEIINIEARVRAWDSLSVDGKNALLLTLFKEFRVEGKPGYEMVIPVLNTLEETELPPIPLNTQVRGRAYFRRFPSVKEWVTTWAQVT